MSNTLSELARFVVYGTVVLAAPRSVVRPENETSDCDVIRTAPRYKLLPAAAPVSVAPLAVEYRAMFRPSAADKTNAPEPLTFAVTPVEEVLALIAARNTPVLSPAAILAVASIAKPLMNRSLAMSEPAVTPVA